MIYTESLIQDIICKSEILKNNLVCPNVSYILYSQCDVLSMNKSGYLTEFEIKISKQDFLKDKTKKKFLKRNEWGFANYFYYVCPENLISLKDIKKEYGLIYIIDYELKIIRKPKLINKKKINKEKVYLKFIRLYSERKYLGSAKLTYLNNEIRKRNSKILNK